MSPQEILEKPTIEEVEALLRSGLLQFKIDIESNSSIRHSAAPMLKGEMAEFLNSVAQYVSAVGPLVQQGAFPMDAAVEVLAAHSRNYNLGSQAEAALDRMADEARQRRGQPLPNPEVMKAMAEQQKAQAELAIKERELQLRERELAIKEREGQLELQLKQAEAEFQAKLKVDEHQRKIEMAAQKHAADVQRQAAAAEAEEIQRRKAEQREDQRQRALQPKLDADEIQHRRQLRERRAAQPRKPRKVRFESAPDGRLVGAVVEGD